MIYFTGKDRFDTTYTIEDRKPCGYGISVSSDEGGYLEVCSDLESAFSSLGEILSEEYSRKGGE